LTAWGRDSDVGRASDGQPVAKIGNNGMSRHRHVHIGAWKDDTPYQIRSYLNAMGVAKQAESADPNDGSGCTASRVIRPRRCTPTGPGHAPNVPIGDAPDS
jgi:hypothetical protein